MQTFPAGRRNDKLLFASILLFSVFSLTTSSNDRRHRGLSSSLGKFLFNNDNNPILLSRRLQRERFRVDFNFQFSEGAVDDYAVWMDVQSFLCQLNRYLYNDVTPNFPGDNNECVFFEAVESSYDHNSNDDTLRLRFFVNGSTTAEGGFVSQSVVDRTWFNIFNGDFDTTDFLRDYGSQAGGLFRTVRTYGFNGSYVPIGNADIARVDCPDNPLPPNCADGNTPGAAGGGTVSAGSSGGGTTNESTSSGHGRTSPLWIIIASSSLFGWALSCLL